MTYEAETVCSEMPAHKIQPPEKSLPKERIQRSLHGRSLKSRIKHLVSSLREWEMSAGKHAKFQRCF
jgi:hypothetical protein